jgi:prepilin-type N-terminal cleavage/methylation domain-containing protein
MAARAQLRGFTLIELLVAITIFGMVVGLASYGYSLYTRSFSRWQSGFQRAAAQYQRIDLLKTALEDCVPWIVRDDADQPGFYFLGRDEGLTLVTQSAVFESSAPAVIRVFREADGQGRWNLVYEEASLKGLLLLRASQTLPFKHRMVVMQGLTALEFEYFGWENLAARAAAENQPTAEQSARWYSDYDGLKRRLHPERIAVQLGGTRVVFLVPERADAALNRYLGPG